jgi:hypothetical protein
MFVHLLLPEDTKFGSLICSNRYLMMVYLAAIPTCWCVEIINELGIMMIDTGCTGHFRVDLLELLELFHWQLNLF